MAPSIPLDHATASTLSRRYYYDTDGGYQLSTGLIVLIVFLIVIKIIFWILVCRYCARRRSVRHGAQDTYSNPHPEPAPPYTASAYGAGRQMDRYSAAAPYGQQRGQGVELGQVSERDKQLLHAESQVGGREIPQAHHAQDPAALSRTSSTTLVNNHGPHGAPEVRYS